MPASLPAYSPPSPRLLSPPYTALPREHEHRLALNLRPRHTRQPRSSVKRITNGNVSLRLVDQDDRIALPVYGLGAPVQGMVEINKIDGITSVQVQIEGTLELEGVAEDGASIQRLFSNRRMLWIKDRIQDVPCPNSLRFSFPLPTTYSDRDRTHLLPPSFEAHLSGLPGFRARVRYTLSAIVFKPNDVAKMVKSTLLRKDDWTVSTPFLYLPRTRPPVPIPCPLVTIASNKCFAETPHWKTFSSIVVANRRGLRDIVAKLYIPKTRTFCIRQPIPFHLSFHSDADPLRVFLSLAPVAGVISSRRRPTQIQLLRQIKVDVRNATIVSGLKTDIWRVDCVGRGAFRTSEIRDDWAAFSGDIFISDEVTVGGFKASGFSVRDYLVLTMTPPELSKSPFKELRMVVPIRLATDRWNDDGSGIGTYRPPSISSSDELAAMPGFYL